MGIKFLIILLLGFFTIAHPPIVEATTVDLFQITTDGSQQTSPFIYGNLVVYTSLSDIWGYDLGTEQNFPILEKEGQQFTTGFYKNLVIYENTNPDDVGTDVYMYNLRTGEDTLIAGGLGSQGNGVTNGREVVYINGGACGQLYSYDIRPETTTLITETACHPVRIWQNIVVWSYAASGGTNVYGYNLVKKELFDIATADGFQEVPNIFGDNVVWLQRTTGTYGDPNSIVMKNLRTGEETTIYESSTDALNWPAISNKYVVWSQSSSQHVGGVRGAHIGNGEVFEVQEQGPHQNSHTMPAIWKDTTVWQAWRTGNGDIYGAEFDR